MKGQLKQSDMSEFHIGDDGLGALCRSAARDLSCSGPEFFWPGIFLARNLSGPESFWPGIFLARNLSGPEFTDGHFVKMLCQQFLREAGNGCQDRFEGFTASAGRAGVNRRCIRFSRAFGACAAHAAKDRYGLSRH